jgi:hypothetical protein
MQRVRAIYLRSLEAEAEEHELALPGESDVTVEGSGTGGASGPLLLATLKAQIASLTVRISAGRLCLIFCCIV